MKSGDYLYVWQSPNWPQRRYSTSALAPLLAQVHQALGQLQGRMRDQGVGSQAHATLEALTEDVLKTSEIEGEHLNPDTVRSSIATRLGVDIGALDPADRHVDGVVEMAGTPLNSRQSKVINRLLDGFEGQLNNKKWAALGKCSSDTALRDINDLVDRGMLRRTEQGGRSTQYTLAI